MDENNVQSGAVASRDEVLRQMAEHIRALAHLTKSLPSSEHQFRVPGADIEWLPFGPGLLLFVGLVRRDWTRLGFSSPENEAAFERLWRALEHLDEVSPEVQVELAEIIEEQTEPLNVPVGSLAGSMPDLPEDAEETLLRWRREVPPTPPIEEQLRGLDEA